MQLLDRRAILVGAIVAAVIAVPASLIGQALIDEPARGNAVFAALVPVVAGFALGGAVAARLAPGAPLANGAIAALAAYLAVELVAVPLNLIQGDDVAPAAIAFAAILAYSAGLLGALVTDRVARRRSDVGSAP